MFTQIPITRLIIELISRRSKWQLTYIKLLIYIGTSNVLIYIGTLNVLNKFMLIWQCTYTQALHEQYPGPLDMYHRYVHTSFYKRHDGRLFMYCNQVRKR